MSRQTWTLYQRTEYVRFLYQVVKKNLIDHSLPNLFCSYTLAKIATFPITFLPVKEFSLHYFVVLHICKYLATSYSMNQIHFVLVSLSFVTNSRFGSCQILQQWRRNVLFIGKPGNSGSPSPSLQITIQWIFDLRKFLGTAKNFLKSNTPSSLKYANWKYYIYFYDPIC